MQTKLLKTLLIPTLGMSTLGTITMVSTSCGSKKEEVVHVTSVELNWKTLFLDFNQNASLVATVYPIDAIDKSVTRVSSNNKVATVDDNGNVIGLTDGTATITVTTNDGGFTDSCEVEVYETSNYLIVKAKNDATLELSNNGGNNPDLQYSTDGENWTKYTGMINIPTDTKLYLKGNNPNGWSSSDSKYTSFSIHRKVDLSGNIMGLIDNGAGTATNIPCDYCFYSLFDGCSYISNTNKILSSIKTLKPSCFERMFYSCNSLSRAPELPITTLAKNCYKYMFFLTGIKTAPDLPATKLAEGCYDNMFNYCTSLTTVPDLPATTLAQNCYTSMFSGCNHLKSIALGYVDNYNSNYFNNWVSNVASSGTFYYNNGVKGDAQLFKLPADWKTEAYIHR